MEFACSEERVVLSTGKDSSRLSRSHHLEIWRHLTGRAVQISEFVGILKNSYDVRNIATNLHKSTRFLRYSRSVSTRSIVVFENDKGFLFTMSINFILLSLGNERIITGGIMKIREFKRVQLMRVP